MILPLTAEQAKAAVDAVLDHYASKGHVRPRSQVTLGMVRERLRHFSVDELRLAIDHLHASPWHNGTHKNGNGERWLELTQIVRSDERVDHFLALEPAAVGGAAAADGQQAPRVGRERRAADILREQLGLEVDR